MAVTYILTCEHAGNELPEKYTHLFSGKEEILFSHKAIDFGALRLAKHLAKEAHLSLYVTTISRLLVEANRSLDSEELFSKYVKDLPEAEKKEILDRYYFPQRNRVENLIASEMTAGKQVVHLAVHTFTPVLDGKVREAEIGILYDPESKFEDAIARRFKENLISNNPDRTVLYNSPYPGTDDGLPTYLRSKFGTENYAGFELEVNQKFFLDGEPNVWQELIQEITKAWQGVIKN